MMGKHAANNYDAQAELKAVRRMLYAEPVRCTDAVTVYDLFPELGLLPDDARIAAREDGSL